MVLLLLLIFNWFILMLTMLSVNFMFYSKLTNYQFFLMGLSSFAVVCSLAFLFNSALGQWFLRFMSGARKTIAREDSKLNPLIEQVQQAIKLKYGYQPLSIRVMIIDEPLPSAFAIGKETIVFSRALYEMATDEELAGVIAHEFGHIHNGDSNKLAIALGVSTVTLTITWISVFITGVIEFIGGGKDRGNIFSWLLTFTIGMAILLLSVFIVVGNWAVNLAILFVGRKQEYKADAFAINAGFGAGLLSFLDKIKNMQFESPRNLFGRLYATHPSIMLRIGELQERGH